MEHIITNEYHEKTVKAYLTLRLKLSSKMITRLKKDPLGILLNGERVTVRAILHENDKLLIGIERESKTSEHISPVDIPIDIIYEDDHYIAINKPPFMPTHPSHDHYDDTLANAVAHLYEKRGLPFVFRAVNRLDRDTSGIVLLAKDAMSADAFSKLQQNKLVTKIYIALVDGTLESDGKIEGYIKRKSGSVMLREFHEEKLHDEDAYSLTYYERIDSNEIASLVKIRLVTGRTHQIRVSFCSIGHPVCGDSLYGVEDGHSRHMLHARSMSFIHPFTNKIINIDAPLPNDIIEAIKTKGIKHEFR